MANIVIKPASGTLEFNTGVVAGSAVDTTLSGASRLTFDNGELNLVSYATGNLNRFTIDGSTSRLFSTYDQMSGSLMSINTIAGFPVFEAFSDNTIVLGKYGSKDFVSTGNKIGIGTAAPANKLEVFGTGDVSVRITTTGSAAATDFAALRFFQGGVQKGSVIANSGVLRIGAGDGIGASSGVYINSAGSVGIGITSPAAKLDIVHDSSASTPAIYVKGGVSGTPMGKFERIYGVTPGTTYVDISAHAGNPQLSITSATNTFAIGTNNSNSGFEIADNDTIGTNPRFVIDVNGNVGIGSTTPSSKLEVSGTIRAHANTGAQAFAAPAHGGILIGEYGNGGAGELQLMTVNLGNGYGFKFMGNVAQGNLELFRRASSTTWTHVMTYNVADGNVGIGTTNPSGKLSVMGPVSFGTNLDTVIGSSNLNSAQRGNLYYNGATARYNIVGATNVSLGLGTNGVVDKVVIDTNGNVGIGSTTPSAKLEISGGSIQIDNNQSIKSRLVGGGLVTLLTYTTANQTRVGANTEIEMAGYIAFRPTGIENMRINSSGNVGIGTTTPTQKLDLSGTLRINSADTYSDPAVDNAGFINYNTADGILTLSARNNGGNTFTAFRTSNGGTGSEKMRITNDGNVGIGTTSPVAKLTVIPTGQAFDGTNAMVAYFGKNTPSGEGSTFIRVARYSNVTGLTGALEVTDIEHNAIGAAQSFFRYGTFGDTNIINGTLLTHGPYGNINFVTAGSVKMTIAGGTASGYVGIGTATPTSKLTVVQDAGADSVLLELQSNNDPSIRFGRSSYGSLIRHISDATDYIAFNCNGASKPSVSATAQVVFTENGNVGIGTTTPIHKLDVNGYVNIASANGLRWANGNIQITNATYDMLLQTYDGVSALTEKMRITSVGNVGIGTTTPSGKLEAYGTGDISLRITTSGNNATTDFAALRFFQGGAQKGSVIANSGVLRIGAGDGIGANSGVYVNSAGSVGIGISPAYPLQIRRSAGGGSLAISVNNVMSQYGRDSLYLAIADVTTDVAGHAWYVRNTTATDNFAMGINNLGNVGIGTDRPTGKLEVLGAGDVSVRITTSGNAAATDFAALRFFQGGAQKGSVIANNSVLRLSAGTNLSGIFISDSGNVGINSIPTGANNVRFQVNGGVGSGIAALRFENCGISGAGSAGIGGKTFSSWLPIQIDSSTTRYIPLYA